MYGTTQFARPLRYVLRDGVLHKVRTTRRAHAQSHDVLNRYAAMDDGVFTLSCSTMPSCMGRKRFSRRINTSEQTHNFESPLSNMSVLWID